MSDQRTDTLLAFLLGAAVGAGVALLLAPASGAETRKKIGDGARKVGDELGHRLHDVKDEVTAKGGDFQKAIAAGKDAYERARHAGEPAPTSTAM